MTVPVEEIPPLTDAGLRVRDESEAGLIVRVAVLELAPSFAVMVAGV